MTLIDRITLYVVKASTFHYFEEKIIVNKTHQLIPGVVSAIFRVMVRSSLVAACFKFLKIFIKINDASVRAFS
jgi:hypothetical protein